MKTNIIVFCCGVLISIAIGYCQISRPEMILAFLNFSKDWNPIVFISYGIAVMVYMLLYHLFLAKDTHNPFRELKEGKEKLSADLIIGAPLFEKIREGELWRVITPCFLHSDIFHLLFNMIWLIVLGKQIEQRMKPLRYVLFILITGIVTNTAQYLMTGSDFLGISGVLCAMLSFIWVRQRKAAWEGYRMDRSTFAMMGAFIVMMFAIQVFYFFMEVQGLSTDFMRIANTAHLSGIAIGYIIGKIDTLAVK